MLDACAECVFIICIFFSLLNFGSIKAFWEQKNNKKKGNALTVIRCHSMSSLINHRLSAQTAAFRDVFSSEETVCQPRPRWSFAVYRLHVFSPIRPVFIWSGDSFWKVSVSLCEVLCLAVTSPSHVCLIICIQLGGTFPSSVPGPCPLKDEHVDNTGN